MIEYTIKREHVKNLLILLEMEHPCRYCPATMFPTYNPISDLKLICKICREFVGLDGSIPICPCIDLGQKEAIKRTWIALDEGGFLDGL